MRIEVISATRLSKDDFWTTSALGISLRRLSFDGSLSSRICVSNTRGLPEIYNEGILAADSQSIVVLVHDDVWIDDYFLHRRLTEGLNKFDVIGVAGNRRCLPEQPAWAFAGPDLAWDVRSNLSGAVAHGKYPFGEVSYFGEAPAACELLDGVFLAAKRSVLTTNDLLFDKRFDFHFYDMDFCRSARSKNLSLGTWPIALTHQSGGAFGTDAWQRAYRDYLKKWDH